MSERKVSRLVKAMSNEDYANSLNEAFAYDMPDKFEQIWNSAVREDGMFPALFNNPEPGTIYAEIFSKIMKKLDNPFWQTALEATDWL